MMWLLLFGSTALVVLLPMLPAIGEWRRPTDLQPLYIDTHDTLDPPYLARAFAASLAQAVATGQKQVGPAPIVTLEHPALWPLTMDERSSAASGRVWRSRGDMTMPPGLRLLAEAAASASLDTATGGSYRALWAGGRLRLAPRSTVTHWAHGAQVEVASGCRLTGRVSADDCITLLGRASFTMLHAPAVRFASPGTSAVGATAAPAAHGLADADPSRHLTWDAGANRGTSTRSLDIAGLTAWRGDVVCQADVWIGTGCNADGSLKAHGVVVVGAYCHVDGNIVAEGGIALGDGCVVRGSVISETAIVLGAGCVIGDADRPATVSAPRIDVGFGVRVYGTLWAGEQGNALPNAGAAIFAEAGVRMRSSAFAVEETA